MSDSAFIVERSLQLAMDATSEVTDVAAILGDLPGVIDVRGLVPGRCAVRYDRREVGLKDLEKCLLQRGIHLAGGPFRRMARGWIGFLDANARGNAGRCDTPCCSNPREIYASRRKR